jgi:hypothetical protein
METVAEIAADCHPSSSSLELDTDKIYETLSTCVPQHIYIDDKLPAGQAYIDDMYLMLQNRFPMQLDPQVITIACNRYFERACKI